MTTLTLIPTEAAIAASAGEDLSRYFVADAEHQLVADPSRRTPVFFDSDGLRIAAHLYRPPGAAAGQRTPAVAMNGPFSSVKEQTLPHYAERFADAGYTVLAFDARSFGESEGRPRAHHVPEDIIADYSNAVGHLLAREDVDPERIGLVGVCMGGGYAMSAAARDRRVRAVASVAGGYDIGATFQRLLGVEPFAAYLRRINALHDKQRETGEVQYVPTIAHALSDEIPVAAMPSEEPYAYYARTSHDHAPTWSARMTAACLESYLSYDAIPHAGLLAPTPLLIVHGTRDFFLLPEYAQAAYDAATGPKQLVWIETHNHIELYDQEPYVSEAIAAVVPFLDANLAG
jgi:uncharacterized protein